MHFLGYAVSSAGIEPDPAKTDKINKFPTPTDATSVRRFLGLASYYRRFVPNFSVIAAPLNQLTKKNAQFEWTENCKISFERLKSALMSAPVLVYPRFGPGNTFILEMDASIVGLGAVLSHTQKKVYNRLRHYVWWSGMKSDVHDHCKACLTCVSRSGGCRPSKPPLQPIPVGGPFHSVAVDVLQLPLTAHGNQYVVVFMYYFTKWPEAFAVSDQSAKTIAKLFTEQFVCRHGIPEELLSNQRVNFLSNLMQELCKNLGVRKLNNLVTTRKWTALWRNLTQLSST